MSLDSRSHRARTRVIYVESSTSEESEEDAVATSDDDGSYGHDSEGQNEDYGSDQSRSNNSVKASTASRTDGKAFKHEISSDTAMKRANFFVAKRESFLPLLPAGNLIDKLVERKRASNQLIRDRTIPYEKLKEQPKGVKAVMKPYQLQGLSFLVYMNRNGMSSILGDEMGLGKTLQTLSLLQYLKVSDKRTGSVCARPSLVICPLSVLNSWMNEAKKWTPRLNVLRFHGPQAERDNVKIVASGVIRGNRSKSQRPKIINLDSDSEDDEANKADRGLDLIVTTYEAFLAEESWFKRAFVWRYVVLDEGHRIKNEESLVSKSLHSVSAEYRLLLSGTPVQNNLKELWALLHWLYPEVFTENTSALFRDSFNLTKGQASKSVMDQARVLLETIMLRRMKDSPGVELNLPPKNEILLYIPLTPMQRFWYLRLLTRVDQGLLNELFDDAGQEEIRLAGDERMMESRLDLESRTSRDAAKNGHDARWTETRIIMQEALQRENGVSEKKPAWKKLMNLLMQLRKCCNHPYLLPHAEPDPYYLGEHVVHASGKFIVLDKMLDELVVKQRKKIIIFSGFTGMLDLCEDLLATRGKAGKCTNHIRLDGSTVRARRNLSIRMFNQADSQHDVILLSTRAGGLGINLASASEVILLDEDWNPQITLQAEARAHRIGQKNAVTVYKLCTQGTVEEQMLSRIQKKLYLSAKVTESMRNLYAGQKAGGVSAATKEDCMPQLDTRKLMSLVRRGTQTLARPEIDVNEMLGWDWPTTLHKCKDQVADMLESSAANTASDQDSENVWLSQIEQVHSRIFDGKKQEASKEAALAQEALKREDRRVGKHTTVMVDGHSVSKESLRCEDWEAVPTFAGKDPNLADVKREKPPPFMPQDHCQTCFEPGQSSKGWKTCTGCPRSFHFACLSKDCKARAKGGIAFSCSQHRCRDCLQNTQNAGGMLYRCRWCADAYCEDCLKWDESTLIGETLKEFEMLAYPAKKQAFFIICNRCSQDAEKKQVNRDQEKQINKQYEQFVRQREEEVDIGKTEVATSPSSTPGFLTRGPTAESSAVTTPLTEPAVFSAGKKRKLADLGGSNSEIQRKRLVQGLQAAKRAISISP